MSWPRSAACALSRHREPAEGARLDVALVKALTGQDPITARFLVQGIFHLHPGVQDLADDQPPAGDPRDARRHLGSGQADPLRRAVLSPRRTGPARQRPGKISTSEQTLRSELPGILAWAVRGCLALAARWAWGPGGSAGGDGCLPQPRWTSSAASWKIVALSHDRLRRPPPTSMPPTRRGAKRPGSAKNRKCWSENCWLSADLSADRVGKRRVRTWFGVGLRDG